MGRGGCHPDDSSRTIGQFLTRLIGFLWYRSRRWSSDFRLGGNTNDRHGHPRRQWSRCRLPAEGQGHPDKSEFHFEGDHPQVFSAEDEGATPVESLLASLAGCLTAGVAAVAQNRGIQLRSVEATLEGDMDIRGILGVDPDVRNGFSQIKVTYNIDADATPDEKKALVAQSQKRSAVYDAITNPTRVIVDVI